MPIYLMDFITKISTSIISILNGHLPSQSSFFKHNTLSNEMHIQIKIKNFI